MEYFDKLPKNYQDGMNKAVSDFWGDGHKVVSEQFLDCEAESLLGCEIFDTDEIRQETIDDWIEKLCWFNEGWEAREKCVGQPNLL